MAHLNAHAAVRRGMLSIPQLQHSEARTTSFRSTTSIVHLFIVFLLLSGITAFAQEYRGAISGRVTDPGGNVVPNAVIKASRPEQTYDSKTDSKGDFYIPFVQPGTYKVSAEAPGFKTVLHTNVVIDVSATVTQSFALPIGEVNETISVNENTLTLSTADASGGTVMDPDLVQNLPLNGRQVYMLLQLTPGVKFTQTQFGAGGGFSGTRAWDVNNSYSITGLPGSTNQFLLNGAPISIQGGGPAGTWNISPSIDAVQEFKVMTITFDAQYGRIGGGATNTIIKNGSPHFHGTAYDFWENSILEANDYQLNQTGQSTPFHNEHQFGGTIGGPFLKHNAFAFFSYEGYREVLPAVVRTTVPTPDLFPGGNGVDLTNFLNATGRTGGIYDPLTTTCVTGTPDDCQAYGRQQFAGNVIPNSRISPIGLAIEKLYPAPNQAGYTNNYVFNGRDRYSYNMPIARVDYNFSDRTKLYGVFAWWRGHEYRNGNGFVGPAITGNIDWTRSSITQVLDLTHTFTPSLIGDVRVSFNRYFTETPSGTVSAGINTFTPADLGLTMPQIPTTSRNWAPAINMNDGFSGVIGDTNDPNMFETYDVGPSITQIVRNHSLHYGGEFSLYHDIPSGVGAPNGNFTFGSGYTQHDPRQQVQDGSVIADLLLGYPDSGGVDYNVAPYESYKYSAFFVQDNWKVKPNFTINAGIRYDAEFSPIERHNRLLAGMCFTCVNPISASVPSLSPLLGTVLFASSKQPAYPNNTGLFQPKIGASWGINRNLVLHGGWTLGKAFGIELGGASAFNQTTPYNATSDGGLTPNNFFRAGNPFSTGYITPPGDSQGALALVGTGFGIDLRDRKILRVQQYTLGIQGTMPFGMVGELTYLGSHATDLRASRQLNGISAADFAHGHADPNYLNQNVPNPFYGVLPNTVALGQNSTIPAALLKVPYPAFDGNIYDYTFPGGYSNYNSMLGKLEKRVSGGGALTKGLSFLMSFTWSRLNSATGYLNNNGASLVDPEPYYSVDGSDRPWDLAFSGLYGLPVGRGGVLLTSAHGFVGQLVNDWQMEWTFSNDGGTPIGYPNGENYNCGNYDILSPQKSYKSYLNNTNGGVSNHTCFSTFSPFTAVTQKPLTTVLRNPWAQQTALGFEKKFAIREGTTLQFKAEAFNLTNTPIFAGPNTGSPDQVVTPVDGIASNQPGAWTGYGTIGSTQQNFPRTIQLSLKLAF